MTITKSYARKSVMEKTVSRSTSYQTQNHTILFYIVSWGTTGGWKPNSIVYITNNGCSKAKFISGNAWYTFQKAFNIPSGNCQLPMGTYSTLGYDTSLLEDNNFPKVYFYGKNKFVGKIKTKGNKLLGCIAYEVEALRPWDV